MNFTDIELRDISNALIATIARETEAYKLTSSGRAQDAIAAKISVYR